jgi:hypothetical protein
MSNFKRMGTTYAADAVTGERMNLDDRVLDTGYRSRDTLWFRKTKTRFIKEKTLAELVEKAGWKLCECGDSKSDKPSVGVSSLAPRVVNADAGVGAGEAEVGTVKAVGRKAAKRRSDGAVKD